MPTQIYGDIHLNQSLKNERNLPAFAISSADLQSVSITTISTDHSATEPLSLEKIMIHQSSPSTLSTLCPYHPARESKEPSLQLQAAIPQLTTFAIRFNNPLKPSTPFRRIIMSDEYIGLYLASLSPTLRAKVIANISHLPNKKIRIIGTSLFSSYTAQFIAKYVCDNQLLFKQESEAELSPNTIRCHIVKQLPSKSDWATAYANDVDMNYIIGRLKESKAPWAEKEVRKVHKNFWEALRSNSFTFKNDRLVIYKLIGSTNRYLSLIAVPFALRRTVFTAYHASGVGAHMGKYKTLLAIRMRFFWPNMRKDIMAWVDGCPDCIPARIRRRESTGLVHSWPVTTPFSILSVDIWKPGATSNPRGYNGLLNTMCDMSQFVVSVPICGAESSYVARIFMESVLLKFGICAMVVVDEGSEYRRTFEQMCKALKLRFHPVAKRNHKAVGVERFHKFLNHAQTIATEQRGTPEIFVECAMTAAYAWNASVIDGTDIVRSIPAIGRVLKFPLDIIESEIPTSIDDSSASIVKYMQYLGNDVSYSRQLLQWIIHDRREQHRERVNEKRNLIKYQAGDVVMGRVAVTSKASEGKVAKLVYQSRGPFIILEDTGHSSYIVKRYGNPDNKPTFKFLTEDLYLLPKQVLPCTPLDTPDMRYLNTDHAPFRHPFSGSFDIEGYNSKWYDDEPPTRPPDFILDEPICNELEELDYTPSQSQPNNTNTSTKTRDDPVERVQRPSNDTEHLPPIEIEPSEPQSSPPKPISDQLQDTTHKLVFVKFTATDTMQARWYLVRVDFDLSDNKEKGEYFCTFFQKHPNDATLPDNRARWWPEWRELEWDASNEFFEFGRRILFGPSSKPDTNKYGLFGTDITLSDSTLTNPFSFLPKSSVRPANSIVPDASWRELQKACIRNNLAQPTLSLSTRRSNATASVYRKRLQQCNVTDVSSLMLTKFFAHSRKHHRRPPHLPQNKTTSHAPST